MFDWTTFCSWHAVTRHSRDQMVTITNLLIRSFTTGSGTFRDRSLFIAWGGGGGGGRGIFVVTSEHLPDPPVEYLVF